MDIINLKPRIMNIKILNSEKTEKALVMNLIISSLIISAIYLLALYLFNEFAGESRRQYIELDALGVALITSLISTSTFRMLKKETMRVFSLLLTIELFTISTMMYKEEGVSMWISALAFLGFILTVIVIQNKDYNKLRKNFVPIVFLLQFVILIGMIYLIKSLII